MQTCGSVHKVAGNVKAFMLLGNGYSSARQQVLNKDMAYKSYSKARLENGKLELEPIRITEAE